MQVRLTPLEAALRAFGSYAEIARIVGRDKASVWRWGGEKARRPAGTVPAEAIPPLLAEARRREVPLTLEELLPQIPGAELEPEPEPEQALAI